MYQIQFDLFQQKDDNRKQIFNVDIITKITSEVLDELNDFRVII